jgi:cytoskeletal protein CcmA (bactofilin family)
VGLFSSKSDSTPSVTAVTPQRERREPPASISAEAPTVIGKDTVVKGELKSTTDMLIEGRVEGQIQGANHVIIGESGDVEARVEAQVVTVRGTVRGDCEGTKKVEITSTGKVFGNIASRAIVVAEGATFKGASKMAQAEPEVKAESPASRLPDAPAQPAPPGIAPAPSTGVS